MKPLPQRFLELDYVLKFWSHASIKGKDECWLWEGNKYNDPTRGQRPIVNYKKVTYLAHRVAYFIFYRVDPGELLVCHRCDIQLCVNPRCLFLGTHQANSTDCVLKNRQYRPIGELNVNAEIDQTIAEEIRRLYKTGKYRQIDLGAMFHLSQPAISMIVNNQRW